MSSHPAQFDHSPPAISPLGVAARALVACTILSLSPVHAQPGPSASGTATPLTSPPATPAEADAAPAPALNWVLPIFTDKEGYRSMTLRGSEVRPFRGGVTVTDLSITIFTGGATPVVESILLSPIARFVHKENRAMGDKSVRFIRDDIEVTGEDWVYDHNLKKISLQRNVRVTFQAQLKDILK